MMSASKVGKGMGKLPENLHLAFVALADLWG